LSIEEALPFRQGES